LLDSSEALESVGSLVTDSTRVYSRLEIEVEISKFALRLYGYRQDEKKLIFSARVGLGSPDFPTPRGSYYVMRIYDDHPLWIPPSDREWAWGQSPSRSVYGGHMMPLFVKRPDGRRYEPTNSGTDSIAPRMQIVDSGGYRVHGTDSPWSVGSGQSHGCIRMLNSTVAQLANSLKLYVGTTERGESANGVYIDLARPVKLVLH
jgi:lipoprotein-anchoring transpeptidase ErfK/SrfK